jgi:hypothetical protein
MNKIIIVLIALLCGTSAAMAQDGRAAMQVKLSDNSLVTVVIDGRQYRRYGNTLTIGNLPAGKHEVKVYRFYPANDPGYRSFGYNRSHARLLYRGKLRVAANRMYYCVVDTRYKTMDVRESGMLALDNNPGNHPIRSESVFSDSVGSNSDHGLAFTEQTNQLKDAQLESLQQSVVTKLADTEKLKQIKDYLEKRSVTSEQVATMMGWLNFEATRLELAKWAYSHVIDQDTYHLASDKLEQNESRNELEQYISGK